MLEPIDYIHFENFSRWHSVYIDGARIITYCGREVPNAMNHKRSYTPPAVCKACRTRMKLSYLIPADLKAAKEAAIR